MDSLSLPHFFFILFMIITVTDGVYETSTINPELNTASTINPVQQDGVSKYFDKPDPEEWANGILPKDKEGLLQWLINGCWGNPWKEGNNRCELSESKPPEYPGFDGWYNNIAHPEKGAVDTPLLRTIPSSYEDGVYQPSGKRRPNPLELSEALMNAGDSNEESVTGKSAFLVFFGQQVVEEILDAQRPACPPEYFNIKIPDNHSYKKEAPKHSEMPVLRTRYDMRSGYSPNNPRQQLNEITPYIDGGLVYGTSKAWSDKLRQKLDGDHWVMAPHGMLATTDDGLFPAYNSKSQLPLANPPPPVYHEKFVKAHRTCPVSRFFQLGNPRGNENAFLLSFGVLWFRWHNVIAKHLHAAWPKWDSERVFSEARKWVIATQQHIIINDWLPQWLDEKLDPYQGYNPHVDPQIEQPFQSAAMRFGHTLVPKGIFLRDYARNGCNLIKWERNTSFVRTCNIFWRPQEPILANYSDSEIMDVDRLLMGMAFQLAEREDNKIVEDLRGRVFGPLEFSRRDLMALNIQRARDHGLPDYNTIRKHYGLPKVESFDHFRASSINQTVRPKLKRLYKDKLDDIDLWVGGLLETRNGPGELFTKIIKDQFQRIRDGDRFWYANLNNGLFTASEVERIEKLRIYDIVMAVTKMRFDDIQRNPFKIPVNDDEIHIKCLSNLEKKSCINRHTEKKFECSGLPKVRKEDLIECTVPETYDYFSGSKWSFTFTFLGIGILTGGLGILLLVMVNWQDRLSSQRHSKLGNRARDSFSSLEANTPFAVEEWIGRKEPNRRVILMLDVQKKQIQILSQKGSLLRAMDLSHTPCIDIFIVNDGTHILLRVSHDYDLVVRFESEYQREQFLILLENFIEKMYLSRQRVAIRLKSALHQAVTKADRQKRLEMFFRVVFSQAFNIEHSEEEILSLDSNAAREVIYTELTIDEFADALSMKPDSEFVIKMFSLVDKDKNGFISFREFMDILVIFAKGSADDKAKLMFDIYDINGTGLLTKVDFTQMIKSLMDTVNAELEQSQLEGVIHSMMMSAGLAEKEAIDVSDFQKLLVDYKDSIGYAGLSFAGLPAQSQMPTKSVAHRRMSSIEVAQMTVENMYGGHKMEAHEQKRVLSPTVSIDEQQDLVLQATSTTMTSNAWMSLKRFVENYSKIIFWTALYTFILLGIFAERCYYYTVEREHSGLRRITGYGVTVTRGAASAMMFTYSSMLVTMCRNTITHLRETFLHEFIPFDSFIFLHKYIALWAFFFTGLHVVGHSINFYHISTQTADDLTCLFRNYFHATHELPKFHYWCWNTITGVTGVILTILVATIGIFSVPYARNKFYSSFWFAHSLYPFVYIFMVLHGMGRLVQEPFFHYFFLGPCILFTLDRTVSFTRKKVEIPVIKAELLPSNVTMLQFKRPSNFEYRSGQWVRISCPAINASEFHPFTLSSAPHEPHLMVYIRAIGPWTSHLRQLYDPNILRTQHLPKIYLDGPYGAGHQDWYQFEVSVLIGGGIGVTPFASILKDIVFRSNMKLETTCKKVYFLWITRTQKQFEWLVDIIRDLETIDKSSIVSVHLFVTQFYEKFDLRTILLYICERHFQRVCGRSLFTGLMAVTHFGRPDFPGFFDSLQQIHSKTGTVGVFSCGPPPMTKAVDKACISINRNTVVGPIFRHYFKNF